MSARTPAGTRHGWCWQHCLTHLSSDDVETFESSEEPEQLPAGHPPGLYEADPGTLPGLQHVHVDTDDGGSVACIRDVSGEMR